MTEQLLSEVEAYYGQQAKRRLLEWQAMVYESQQLDELEKLHIVNRFINKTQFINDMEHWQQQDYWATPVELLASNGGDCEDFSIAKYFSLTQMGIPVERLRITYVNAIELDQAHMVLTYYARPDAEPLVLDNLINEVKPASAREDLVPVYSFNGDGLWLARASGQSRYVGSSKRIRLWRELGLRIKQQNNI